ncbi:hypothetical protein SISNIDRAFT_545975 [Sistotremastrum niveocremeum HHB9708]|uniref:Protein CPL1-like domain-containing protein n=1 Tax=Sistotremastrum niveocremeum HHB9708 TaxID=1314777 RepID=A0A165AKK6_9AGAM|nr:hypothetical protein SISNIDRAFT_545975 [Sistotremastrum niveocremeum HHB9708]
MLFALLLLPSLFASFVYATTPTTNPWQCLFDEFFYQELSCCLKVGGSNIGRSPAGAGCPNTWYWHSQKDCCVPSQPGYSLNPFCPSGYVWNKDLHYCQKPQPPARQPQCSGSEFWWENRGCCLPHNGPGLIPPTPPPNKQCPGSYYWHWGEGCCVPYHPSPPPPTCDIKWKWNPSSWCCEPGPPTPPPSQPSPHHNKRVQAIRKSHKRDQVRVGFCPSGFSGCPIRGRSGTVYSELECLDTTSELTSCGGCASVGRGVDCSKIPHALGSTCLGGQCKVDGCQAGFRVSNSSSACVPY